ncbi:MFS transporter [Jannaschia aquimarina]|uniref:Major Facilitator Superfamily protein n=1 Tax=Jannaschia aquimarina TaxID=935700 RepID=A0A0D1EDF0_9RHOB|nr:MFS transporter [Jannaschia aquimarina]KIT14956.1 Major Facilitator Superfamily protein [Jannaschia aquimarina]SNS60380.1 Predicted arabinose efflux permease, MFS family [Jannaschia aquimarina]
MNEPPRQSTGAFLRQNGRWLSAGALISFTSSYGQTFFIALFAGQIMGEFGLTDGTWGTLYAVATIVSAGAMIAAGPWTDRLRVRHLATLTCLTLAVACLSMAGSRGLIWLAVTVFLLRFAGQGMMSHLAAVGMARWFAASRGRALAIAATGFALGQAILPVLFVQAGAILSWRTLWVVAALAVVATIPVILYLLRTERHPSGSAEGQTVFGLDGIHWTRAQMLRSGLFWALVPLMLGPPAFGTALFFHQVHLVDAKGWDLAGYVALLPLFTVVSVATMLLSGVLLDRYGAARLMRVYLLPFALGFWAMGMADTLWGAALALTIFGIGTGAQGTLPTACWAELYGTRHLGAIKSVATGIMVLGSAIGPAVTGWTIDAGFDFPQQMIAIVLYFLAATLLAAWALTRALPRLSQTAEIDVVRA